MHKMPRGSFDQALWPQALVVRALKPAVCLHGPLLLGRSSLPFASPQMPKIPCGSSDQALWPQAFLVRALKPAVCLHGALLLGRSSLPFASPQMPKMSRGSFDQALWPQAYHFLLEPCRLPFASMVLCCYGVQACRLPAVKCLKCPAAASTRHSGHKHLLLESWSLPFASMHSIVRAFKPAVCQPSNAPRQLRPGTLATSICC